MASIRASAGLAHDNISTETGSNPLGDSSAPDALRYATGATHRILGKTPPMLDDRRIEVKQ
ncbi:hypothetical protein ASJ79_12565 [Mycobacterium sp. NAZ190054]|nr:hypothetical protein ASJ79_12565 [Mycobacterium sp. NAZ190054]